jgi:hypothetical protein
MPMFLFVRVAPGSGARPITIWLPLFLLWILLAPVLGLALIIVFVVAALTEINPFRAVSSLAAVFCGLAGTRVEVNAPDARVSVRIA